MRQFSIRGGGGGNGERKGESGKNEEKRNGDIDTKGADPQLTQYAADLWIGFSSHWMGNAQWLHLPGCKRREKATQSRLSPNRDKQLRLAVAEGTRSITSTSHTVIRQFHWTSSLTKFFFCKRSTDQGVNNSATADRPYGPSWRKKREKTVP